MSTCYDLVQIVEAYVAEQMSDWPNDLVRHVLQSPEAVRLKSTMLVCAVLDENYEETKRAGRAYWRHVLAQTPMRQEESFLPIDHLTTDTASLEREQSVFCEWCGEENLNLAETVEGQLCPACYQIFACTVCGEVVEGIEDHETHRVCPACTHNKCRECFENSFERYLERNYDA